LVGNLLSESEELAFLAPVTKGLDAGGKSDSKVDGYGLNPSELFLRLEREEEEDGGEHEEHKHVVLVKLVPEDG
jgi:hypothetical protein